MVLIDKGYRCSIHNEIALEITADKQWRHLSEDWRRRHPLCALCEADDVVREGVEVHHIEARALDNPLIPLSTHQHYLITLCKQHHSSITRTELIDRAADLSLNQIDRADWLADRLGGGVVPGRLRGGVSASVPAFSQNAQALQPNCEDKLTNSAASPPAQSSSARLAERRRRRLGKGPTFAS